MDKGGRHEKKSDGDSEESDEQRKKKSWKAEFCLFSFTPIQQSLKLLKKTIMKQLTFNFKPDFSFKYNTLC